MLWFYCGSRTDWCLLVAGCQLWLEIWGELWVSWCDRACMMRLMGLDDVV